jgi:hypothetical protein
MEKKSHHRHPPNPFTKPCLASTGGGAAEQDEDFKKKEQDEDDLRRELPPLPLLPQPEGQLV